MSDKLRECPFCGDTDIEFHTETSMGHVSHFTYCTNCEAQGPRKFSLEAATELWNDREPENDDPRSMGWVDTKGQP